MDTCRRDSTFTLSFLGSFGFFGFVRLSSPPSNPVCARLAVSRAWDWSAFYPLTSPIPSGNPKLVLGHV